MFGAVLDEERLFLAAACIVLKRGLTERAALLPQPIEALAGGERNSRDVLVSHELRCHTYGSPSAAVGRGGILFQRVAGTGRRPGERQAVGGAKPD